MKLLLLRIFFFEGRGELMARGIDFWEPRLEEHTAPSSFCLCQYLPELSHRSGNRISVSSEKSLTFITNVVFLLLKYDGNYNW